MLSLLSWHSTSQLYPRVTHAEVHRHIMNDLAPVASAFAQERQQSQERSSWKYQDPYVPPCPEEASKRCLKVPSMLSCLPRQLAHCQT